MLVLFPTPSAAAWHLFLPRIVKQKRNRLSLATFIPDAKHTGYSELISASLYNFIFKRADRVDGDANSISTGESEGVWRDDSGSCHQESAEGKAIVPKQVFNKSGWRAFQLGKRCSAG